MDNCIYVTKLMGIFVVFHIHTMIRVHGVIGLFPGIIEMGRMNGSVHHRVPAIPVTCDIRNNRDGKNEWDRPSSCESHTGHV